MLKSHATSVLFHPGLNLATKVQVIICSVFILITICGAEANGRKWESEKTKTVCQDPERDGRKHPNSWQWEWPGDLESGGSQPIRSQYCLTSDQSEAGAWVQNGLWCHGRRPGPRLSEDVSTQVSSNVITSPLAILRPPVPPSLSSAHFQTWDSCLRSSEQPASQAGLTATQSRGQYRLYLISRQGLNWHLNYLYLYHQEKLA